MTVARELLRDVAIRAYAAPLLHRAVPAALALPFIGEVEPRVRRRLRPAEETEALSMFTDLLQFTPRADDAPAVARRYLREKAISRELFWRSWLLRDSRVIDGHHWDAAHGDGRGCVMVLGHIGGSWAVPGILGQHGYDVHVVTSAHMWEEQPSRLMGRVHRYLRREYGDRALGPDRLIPNTTPPERVHELVETGATVAIAFDVPGSAATPFLGRSVPLASGPSSLAFHAKVKVLPVITQRRGTRMELRMLEPLDPADFKDLRALRVAVARIYEALLLEHPELVEVAWGPLPLVTEADVSQAPGAQAARDGE